MLEGDRLGSLEDGMLVGATVGVYEGVAVEGEAVGSTIGLGVGILDGSSSSIGAVVGVSVGSSATVGLREGSYVSMGIQSSSVGIDILNENSGIGIDEEAVGLEEGS